MNANRNSNAKNSKKPYCKVCHDAGKAESVYTSHCVKTYNINTGKTDTTCPTLLALECRYCYKSGHTVKFCPVLEENKKMDVERARDRARHEYQARQKQQQTPVQTQNKPKNAFAAFAEEQEDEERENQAEVAKQELQAKQEFPSLMGNTRISQNANVKSYSCVAATPVDERRLEMSRQQRVQATQKKAVSWADEDSESDNEYQEEVYEEPSTPTPANNTPCYARATSDDNDW